MIVTGTHWRRVVTDPEYLAAVAAHEATVAAWVDVLSPDRGTVLARLGGPDATHPGIVGGEVRVDGEGHVHREAKLDINQDDLVPAGPGDLLHPLSWNQVRVWHGTLLPSGEWAAVPLLTGHVDVDDPTDSGDASVSLSVSVSDAAAAIKRALMPMSIQVGGMDAADAAATVLASAAPWADLDTLPLGHRLPVDHEAGEPDADPWDVAAQIVTSAGGRLYVDREGTVVIEPTPEPSVAKGIFRQGPGCRVTQVTAGADLDEVYNTVTVTSGARQDADGNDLEPITVTVSDDDPTSPTWIGHGYVMRHPTITVDEATSYAQVAAVARARLEELRAPLQRVTLEAFPHAHLDPGDLIDLSFPRVGVAGVRTVKSWQLRLGPTGGMRVECEGRL